MGLLFTTGGAIGGALGGTAGYAAGRAAEEIEECAIVRPGILPKAHAIAGCGVGATGGFLVQRGVERTYKTTQSDSTHDL